MRPLVLLLATGCLHGGDGLLDEPNGGFDTADEAPMFGAAPELEAAAVEPDTAVTDPMAADPVVVSLDANTSAGVRDVLVVWGRLPADPDVVAPHDWTGSLAVDRGAVIVHRTIGFEDLTDRLLPRQSRTAIAFASITRPFVDGLALRVLDPTPTQPLALAYTPASGGPAIAIDLDALATGPVIAELADGDRLVALGERRHDACLGGFMRGRWHAVGPDFGAFLGIVTGSDGDPVGHVRGIYGRRRDGRRVVFGKFIDRDGGFVGLLAGVYDTGTFEARWIDRAGDRGAIRGVAFESSLDRAGAFAARWAETACTEDPTATGP